MPFNNLLGCSDVRSRLGVVVFAAGIAVFALIAGGCSGSSSGPLVLATATPTATKKPTPTATPTPVSASQAQLGTALQTIEASAEAFWTGNKVWLGRLLKQLVDTPRSGDLVRESTLAALTARSVDEAVLEIAGANLVNAPDDAGLPPAFVTTFRSEVSTAAFDIHNFETSGAYGDTKDELPRANCDFTVNPKGNCTSATNTLTIIFNDPAVGDDLTAFFDWTGATTGKSSPTVMAHDPLNPGTLIELPTRLVWQLKSKGTTLINLVMDVQWPPSPCVTGKFLFDVPVSADATGFIIGADLSTRIFAETASATLRDSIASGTATVSGSNGDRSVDGDANATVSGTLTRSAKSCGAFENAVASGLIANGSASNEVVRFEPTLTATNLVSDSNEEPRSTEVNGQFFVGKNFGTYSGTLDDTNKDKVPGHGVIIDFSDGKTDFADFFINYLEVKRK